MLTDERILEIRIDTLEDKVLPYDEQEILVARAIEAEVRAEAQEPITSELISSALAAITFYGSQKWAEGKGLISNPALLDVRQSWDAVYAAIQKLAAPPAPCPKCAEQSAEIERQTEFANNFAAQVRQQAERIAELEELYKNVAFNAKYFKSHYEKLGESFNEQTALIEKCRMILAWVDKYVSCAISPEIEEVLAAIAAMNGDSQK